MTGQGWRCAGLAPPGGYVTSTIVASRRWPSRAGNLPENAVRDREARSCTTPLASSAAVEAAATVATLIHLHGITRAPPRSKIARHRTTRKDHSEYFDWTTYEEPVQRSRHRA